MLFIFILSFSTLFILAGCGVDSNKYTIRSITLSPSNAQIFSTKTQQFTCKALYGDGMQRDFFGASFAVDIPSSGIIDKNGLFTASNTNATIEATITAAYGNLMASAEITVSPEITTKEAVALVNTPEVPQNLAVSNITPYTAKITISGGADGYILSFGLDEAASNSGLIEAMSNTIPLSGLPSNSEIFFKAKAFKYADTGRIYSNYSNISSFDTANYPIKFDILENKIIDDKGNTIIFRGVNILDPAWMDLIYKNIDDKYFSALASWKVKIIRVPIHPAAYKYYGSTAYLKILDKVLDLAASHEIYAILDYHSIGFPPEGEYMGLTGTDTPWTGSIYAYTIQELIDFWKIIAEHYKNDNRVVFYELFNEPTKTNLPITDSTDNLITGSSLDKISWGLWKAQAEILVDIIRNINENAKIIVGGINYSYDLSYALKDPVNRPKIVYGTHPYPNQSMSSDTAFGNLVSKYPVFATEFGYAPGAAGKHYQGDDVYGTQIIQYLEGKKIGWTAWNFSTEWFPSLLLDWDYNTTASGSLFKNLLKSH
ncbi:cellulase family glycosylhydrolase [Candidatus Saganbacteria bacterium]|nr:cellulase family glycosylhydrolase [Candidatus Saganbacteria bacterium]